MIFPSFPKNLDTKQKLLILPLKFFTAKYPETENSKTFYRKPVKKMENNLKIS